MARPRDGLISSQFIEVIEWTDETTDTIVYKFPVHNNHIKNGAQLTVRESQVAIFLNEGDMGDIFYPGRYELTTRNIPVLSKLKSWKYGFQSPFKADVYFVNTKQFVGFRWGTANPILMRDQELGVVRLRSFGNFSFRITSPPLFFMEIAGTNPNVTTAVVEMHIKSIAISIFSDTLANARIPVFDLSTKYHELSQLTLAIAQQRFNQIGVEISGFSVENISLPEDVERLVDKRSSMGIIGDFDKYAKFQLADSIPDAMANPGGLAVMGASLALGQELSKALGGTLITPPSPAPLHAPTPTATSVPSIPTTSAPIPGMPPLTSNYGTKVCGNCKEDLPSGAAFCISCGQKVGPVFCPKCGAGIVSGAAFCLKCGEKL